MPDLTNPANALSRGDNVLGLLGSFWTSLYRDNGTVTELARARNQTELQTFRTMLETMASLSRFSVPIYHRENWSVLTLRKSQQITGPLVQFGIGEAVYGNNLGNAGTIYRYGVSPSNVYSFNVQSDLANVNVIVNRISEPSVTLTKEIDFHINTNTPSIEFRDDPFANPLNLSYPVYDNIGVQTDTELQLWLFMADYDWKYIYQQFGYALNIFLSSSDNYRTLMNAIWDSLLVGSTSEHLELLVATLADVPLVKETTETVEDIYLETDKLLIITDRHVYQFSPTAQALVSVNQILRAGDRLVNAFTIYRPYRDTLSSATIPSIALDSNFLIGPFQNELIFNNTIVPLQVSVDSHGRTRIQWALGGQTDDIQKFWDIVHTNGTAVGAISLAQLLDQRYPPAQTPDPLAVNLPSTINPLDFLAKNVLRNNALILVLNTESFGPNALGTNSPKTFRQIIPAYNVVFIIVQITASDVITMTGIGTTISAGYSETLTGGTFTAPDVMSETSSHSLVGTESFSFS